jgi:hypothetical protein
MESHNFERLKAHILPLSVSKVFGSARKARRSLRTMRGVGEFGRRSCQLIGDACSKQAG